MKTTLFRIFFISLFISITNLSFSQSAKPTLGVTGALNDDAGKPMDYVTVSFIRLPDSTIVKGILTDEAGIHHLGLLMQAII